MSILNFNRQGSGSGWNYNDPTKDGYSTTITGDVTKIETVQALDFQTKKPAFWPDGNPKLNIRVWLTGPNGGQKHWTFAPGGSGANASNAMKACQAAIGPNADSMVELGGKNITIVTAEPPQGYSYGRNAPRPWTVQINGPAQHPFQGVVEFQPASVPAPQVPQGVNPAVNAALQAAQAAGAVITEIDPYANSDIPF